MNTPRTILGKYLRTNRKKRGLTQKALSEMLGYESCQFVSNWERGVSSPPLKTLKKITVLLELNPDELFELMLNRTREDLSVQIYGTKTLRKAKH